MTLSDTTNYYSSRPHRFPRKYKSAETFWRTLVYIPQHCGAFAYTHYCNKKATVCSHSTIDMHVAVNIINTESTAMDPKQCIIFTTALHTLLPTIWNTLRSSHTVPDIFVWFWPHMDFLDRFSYNFPISNFVEIHPVGVVLVCVWMDGHDKANRHFLPLHKHA